MGRKCNFCGESIEHRPFQAKYCNDAHRSKANRRKKDSLVGSAGRRLNQRAALEQLLDRDELLADLASVMGDKRDSWNDGCSEDNDAPAVVERTSANSYEWKPPSEDDVTNPFYSDVEVWRDLYSGLSVTGQEIDEETGRMKTVTKKLTPVFLGHRALNRKAGARYDEEPFDDPFSRRRKFKAAIRRAKSREDYEAAMAEMDRPYLESRKKDYPVDNWLDADQHLQSVSREANRRRSAEGFNTSGRSHPPVAKPREPQAPQVIGSALPDPKGTTHYFKAEKLTLPLTDLLSTSTLEGVNVTDSISDADAVRSPD